MRTWQEEERTQLWRREIGATYPKHSRCVEAPALKDNEILSRLSGLLEDLAQKLDMLARLLGASITRGTKKQKDKILMLSASGLSAAEISNLLRIRSNIVRKTLSRARKEAQPLIGVQEITPNEKPKD